MKTVRLGKTGLMVNKVGFGAIPIQRISRGEAAFLLRKAYAAGVNFFDTAWAYSDSEEKIGYALGDVREHIVIATKTVAQDAKGFWEQLKTSLRRLGCGYIDLYQFHNITSCPGPRDGSGLFEAMLEAKEKGLIRHIGVTSHRLAVAEEAVESGLYETLQFPFNYLSAEREVALVERCRELDIGFIAMKALSGGMLRDSAATCAYLDQFEHVVPIWGIQLERELDEFISYMDNPPALDAARLAVIEKDRRELSGNFCRACGYCLPCPADIDIPQAARMSLLLRRMPAEGFLTEEGRRKMMKVNDCVNCGHCKGHCPYGLDTPRLLKENLKDYMTFIK